MSWTSRAGVLGGLLALVIGAGQSTLASARADDPPQPQQQQQQLHNVTYRARVDGLARGAMITYKINDTQIQTANPTMLPGRTFEANTVLADPQQAGMQVSIRWPYSANLHCEILVDDQTSAQANQFIAPRITPASDDPNYGVLSCGAPVDNAAGTAASDTIGANGAPAGTGSTAPIAPPPSQDQTSPGT
jgi:hypothetical protein